MATKKTNSKEQGPQAVVIEIPEESLPPRISYDVNGLRKFINFVFDADNLDNDENILVWKTAGLSPGYPSKSFEGLLGQLKKATRPTKLYYGTATTRFDDEGSLRNRKVLFKAFYVLVLDDIGTKVPFSKIPANFLPSYIIETSAGNFQYGYVLDEPISVLEHAEALVQLVYDGGFSDAGGKMATKLVRLPGGVNGKRGAGEFFPVTLTEMHTDRLWSPSAILDALDLGVTWDDVVEDIDKVMKERNVKSQNLSPWSPLKAQLPSLDGSIDEVAEWLFTADKVKQETPEWLTIECPWSDTHTDGMDTASYSPIGWGQPPYGSVRVFHCFHEHCRGRKTHEFLQHIADLGGPSASVRDDAHALVSRYTFDELDNGVWDTQVDGQPNHIKMDAFNYKHPHKVLIPVDGKAPMKIAETTLFKLAKGRVTVTGPTYDPTTPAKIVQRRNRLYVNLYTQPSWGDGDYNEKDVDMFKDFMAYLIPDKEAREYYLDWLAAKTQSMAFRGPAILMIAPSQGTGRTTLGNMLATMFGHENVENVKFDTLAKGGDSEKFNDWIVKPIIISNETLAMADETNFYKVYERLKELIDTTPQEVRVNPKFGKQRFQMTYSSFMLFSNHENAMSIAENDRRIYVLNNANRPAAPEYFVKLNAWLEQGAWARSVWRWLRAREVDVGQLVAPPTQTTAKTEMLDASKQPIDVAVEAVLHHWPTGQITSRQVKSILAGFHHRFNLKDSSKVDNVILRVLRNATFSIQGKHKVGDSALRVRRLKDRNTADDFDFEDVMHEVSPELRAEMIEHVEDALEGNDF